MKSLRVTLIALAALVAVASPAVAQQEGATPGAGANYETRLSGLEDSLRSMNGRVEQLEYSVKRLELNLQRMQADYDARLTRLESAPPQQPVAVTPPPATATPPPQAAAPPAVAADPSPNGTLGAVKIQDGRVTGGVNNPQSPPLPNAPADYGLTTQEQYDRAFGLLRQANYDEAEGAFKTFIEKNPKDKLIDNAKYWYGETLYVQKRFDESAAAFGDAYQQNPKGTKAPDSLLKLAMSLEALNKTVDACTTLDSLKSQYPNATASVRSRATEERTKLKCVAAH